VFLLSAKKDRLHEFQAQNEDQFNFSHNLAQNKLFENKKADYCPWRYDKKTLNLMLRFYPSRFKLKYPRNSFLSADDQQTYIQLHQRLSRLPPNIDYQQNDDYRKFMVISSLNLFFKVF
jgi:hypothetical protein